MHVVILLLLMSGCRNNDLNRHEKTESTQNINFDELSSNLYSHLTAAVLNSKPLKDSLKFLDSAIIYVVPERKCYSCLNESIEKINADSGFTGIERFILTVRDSTYRPVPNTHQYNQSFRHITIMDHLTDTFGLLEISKIYYLKNGRSKMTILE